MQRTALQKALEYMKSDLDKHLTTGRQLPWSGLCHYIGKFDRGYGSVMRTYHEVAKHKPKKNYNNGGYCGYWWKPGTESNLRRRIGIVELALIELEDLIEKTPAKK